MSETAPASAPTDGQGTTPDPAAPPASSSAALTLTPTPAAPSGPIPWLEGADELTVGYVKNKGWENPAQVLDGYRNLEKLLGADKAGNAVILPKPDASPAEFDAFYNRLGRPAEPTGYKLAVPEGMPKDFAAMAAAKMHELGLPQKTGEALGAWWNEFVTGQNSQQETALQTAFADDERALKEGWGKAYTQELAKAQRAVQGLGVTDAQIDVMQKAMGHKATMEFFNKIGSKIGEPDFTTGQRPDGFGGSMTPEQAKAKIVEMTSDKNFVTRYVNKDAAAVAEMKRLHEFAYPEGE